MCNRWMKNVSCAENVTFLDEKCNVLTQNETYFIKLLHIFAVPRFFLHHHWENVTTCGRCNLSEKSVTFDEKSKSVTFFDFFKTSEIQQVSGGRLETAPLRIAAWCGRAVPEESSPGRRLATSVTPARRWLG